MNQPHENEKFQLPLVILANLTLKELNSLETLLIKIDSYKNKNKGFAQLSDYLNIVTWHQHTLTELVTTLSSQKSEDLLSKLKIKFSQKDPKKEQEQAKASQKAMNRTLGAIRLFNATLLENIAKTLLLIAKENFNAKGVVETQLKIDDAIQAQIQLGNKYEEPIAIKPKNPLPNVLKLEKQLTDLFNKFTAEQIKVSKTFRSPDEQSTELIIIYYQNLSVIIQKYEQLIDLIGKWDANAIIKAIRGKAPWLNLEEKEREDKLKLIEKYNSGVAQELEEHSSRSKTEIEEMTKLHYQQVISNYDDFLLHQSFKSLAKSNSNRTETSLDRDAVGQNLFKEKYPEYKTYIKKLENIFELYLKPGQQDEAASQAVTLFLSIPEDLRKHITTFVNKDLCTVLSAMLVSYPELREAKIYGEIQPKEENIFAEKIYKALKNYLNNDQVVRQRDARKLNKLINHIWEIYFKVTRKELDKQGAITAIEKAIHSHLIISKAKPTMPQWQFLTELSELLHPKSLVREYVKRPNDFAWPLDLDSSTLMMSFLDQKSVQTAALVCKTWHKIATQDVIWQPFYSLKSDKPITVNLKFAVGAINVSNLINQYLKSAQKLNKDSSLNVKSYISFPNFEFEFDGKEIVSNITKLNKTSLKEISEKITKLKPYLNLKIIERTEGCQLKVESVDAKTFRKWIKELEEQSKLKEMKGPKISI